MGGDFTAASATSKNKYLHSYLHDLPDFVFSYIEEYYSGESVNTKLAYSLDIKVFFDFLRKSGFFPLEKNEDFTLNELNSVTPVMLIHFKSYLREYEIEYLTPRGRPAVRTLTNSAYGINRKLSAVRGLFIYLYKTEQISQNVTDKVDFMKLHQKIKKPLTSQETIALIDVLYNGEKYFSGRQLTEYNRRRLRDIALFITYLGTGVRVSELVALNVGDLEFDERTMAGSFIVTRKGGDQQEIFMPPQVFEVLKNYTDSINAKDTDPLFLNRSASRSAASKRRSKPTAPPSELPTPTKPAPTRCGVPLPASCLRTALTSKWLPSLWGTRILRSRTNTTLSIPRSKRRKLCANTRFLMKLKSNFSQSSCI